MSVHKRTSITSLTISGYRSIERLELEDLPPIVVLHGPNGSGKSNILRAAQLALRLAGLRPSPPVGRDAALSLEPAQADESLGLRADDFRAGGPPEVRVTLEVALGDRAAEILRLGKGRTPEKLVLDAAFQIEGAAAIRAWLERASVDDLPIARPPEPKDARAWTRVQAARREQDVATQELAVLRDAFDVAKRQRAPAAQRQEAKVRLQAATHRVAVADGQRQEAESALRRDALVAERAASALIPGLLQVSEAYRVPGGPEDPQAELFDALLSESPLQRAAARRLESLLSRAEILRDGGESVELFPVISDTFAEQQIRFRLGPHSELPLRNLGTGEQQVILMLARRVVTPCPIAQIEEPEAHLHKDLMVPLARVLRESVLGAEGAPEVDQLWIATHHRLFAIHEKYLDVSLDERGATRAVWRPRDEAATHFYEPSPYWDTLRGLVAEGMPGDAVVHYEDDKPVTVRDILLSIDGDHRLADRFVDAATRAFVLSLRRGADE